MNDSAKSQDYTFVIPTGRMTRDEQKLFQMFCYTDIRPTYPANKANTEDIRYAPATITGSLTPHNSK